ncbi:Dnase i-like superfamily protein, partial [Thalictrum thalictroides]
MATPIGFWNVRGMNDTEKARAISNVRVENNFCLVALLETKVKKGNYDFVRRIACGSWEHINNYSKDESGRIWVCWDPVFVAVRMISQSDQYIHAAVKFLPSNMEGYITFIYAKNDKNRRRLLWLDLINLGNSMRDPWCVAGDFNNVLSANEKVGGDVVHPRDTMYFEDCVIKCGITDINASGFFYTWSNKSPGTARIMTRIDRVMVNQAWTSMFPNCGAEFLPSGVSDHSPAKLVWYDFVKKAGPFRFSNAWFHLPGFIDLVTEVWNGRVSMDPMNTLIFKLVELKNRLKPWVKNNVTHLHARVEEAKGELYKVQEMLQVNHSDVTLAEREKMLLQNYGNLARAEYLSLKLKADCDWLSLGDRCTAYFHNSMKERKTRNAIWSLQNSTGSNVTTHQDIAKEFIKYYKSLMGAEDDVVITEDDMQSFDVRNTITDEQTSLLEADVDHDEIKRALFSMGDTKAP